MSPELPSTPPDHETVGPACQATAQAIRATMHELRDGYTDGFRWETLRALLTIRFGAEDTSFRTSSPRTTRWAAHEREHSQMLSYVSDIIDDLRSGHPPSRRDVAVLADWWRAHSTLWDPADHPACRQDLASDLAGLLRFRRA
jgi:hypothetical protein